MQAPQLLVHIDQTGRNARKPAITLIGGIGHVDGLFDGRQKRLETAFGPALLGQGIKLRFGFDDLIGGFPFDCHVVCLRADVPAQCDQLAPDSEVIDHLGIIAHRIGRDGRCSQRYQIGWPAKGAQTFVLLQKRLERDRRGQRVLLDARGADVIDSGVNRVVEMLGPDDRCGPVIQIVVGQQRAQKLLFGFDVMRQRRIAGNLDPGWNA